jgi:RNA polymerase sigma-70 factor (ECF subfamily)
MVLLMPVKPTEGDIRTIYRATVDDLYDLVARRCHGDHELAEDITQETWLRAVDVWRVEGLPERPGAWLARVALRLLSNYRRHEAVERITGDDPDDIPDDPGAAVESAARRSLLQRALDRLPRMQAQLLEAFHLERRHVGDIANTTGLSERAVEGRLRRARLSLRREIEIEEQKGDE